MLRVVATVSAVLVLLGSSIGVRAADPPAEAISIEEAAGQVNFEVQIWDARRRGCSKLLPQYAHGIEDFYVEWLEKNADALYAMLAWSERAKGSPMAFSVIDEGLPDDITAEAARYNMPPNDFCDRLFSSLKAGEFDIARSYPEVAQALATYLPTHPLSTQAERAYMYPLECVKTGLMKHESFDVAQSQCRCRWNTMNAEFTQAEWTEFEAALRSDQAEQKVLALPQYKRVDPKLEACAKPAKSK